MSDESRPDSNRWSARGKAAFGVFLAIGASLVVAEHRAHVVTYLPWLLLAACPLLHLFMHGGHARHGGRDSKATDEHRHGGERA